MKLLHQSYTWDNELIFWGGHHFFLGLSSVKNPVKALGPSRHPRWNPPRCTQMCNWSESRSEIEQPSLQWRRGQLCNIPPPPSLPPMQRRHIPEQSVPTMPRFIFKFPRRHENISHYFRPILVNYAFSICLTFYNSFYRTRASRIKVIKSLHILPFAISTPRSVCCDAR